MHVNFKGYDAQKIIAYLDAHNLDCCWLLTWEELKPINPAYSHLSIDEVINTYTNYPSRIIPMYAPDPQNPESPDLLRKWYHQGVRGCAELKSSVNWQSPETRNLLAVAQELEIPVLFHMEESYYIPNAFPTDDIIMQIVIKFLRTNRLLGLPKIFANLVCDKISALTKWRNNRIIHFPGYMLDFFSLSNALEDFPRLTFIGHGPLFWQGVDSKNVNDVTIYPKGPVDGKGLTCQLLEKYNNLYADLSAGSGLNFLTRDRSFTKNFISRFSNKLLYGTDNMGSVHYKYIESLDLSSDEKSNIFGLNAYKILSKQNL
jgi:predicted TIM-barrel fold metal-dependent hydrolase